MKVDILYDIFSVLIKHVTVKLLIVLETYLSKKQQYYVKINLTVITITLYIEQRWAKASNSKPLKQDIQEKKINKKNKLYIFFVLIRMKKTVFSLFWFTPAYKFKKMVIWFFNH